MAQYIAQAQTVTAGSNVIFLTDESGGCRIRHQNGTGIFTVKGNGDCTSAKYRVSVHVVVTATAAAPISLAITEDGEPIAATTMAAVPAAIGDVLSLDSVYEVSTTCDCTKLALRALSVVPLTSAVMIIDRA